MSGWTTNTDRIQNNWCLWKKYVEVLWRNRINKLQNKYMKEEEGAKYGWMELIVP